MLLPQPLLRALRQIPLLTLAVLGFHAAAAPPNILFIFADDHAWQAVSAYEHPLKLNQTPNIDRLAKDGVTFQRCLVPNSICGPSRAIVMTGKYSHKNGFYNNVNNTFDGTQQTFPKLLHSAGYQTAVIGKWHLISEPTGFDFWAIWPGQGIYYNPPMSVMGKTEKKPGYVTDITTDMALDWLKARDPNRPFLMMCQHKAPHREWAPALRHLGHDNDRKYPEPETLFDDYANRGPAVHAQDMTISKTMRLGVDNKLTAPTSMTPEQRKEWDAYYGPRNAAFTNAHLAGKELVRWKYQRYLHDYLGTVKAVDESVGRLLNYLDQTGLATNTIVVYSSDQGFFLGEHGWFDKRWIFEESARTPLLIRWPGVTPKAAQNRDLVSVVDFAETFLEAAGLPVPADMQGRSLVPLLRGQTPADWRKSFYYHYYEDGGEHKVAKHYGVITDRYKLAHFYNLQPPYWELYDLQKDPQEMRSVFGQTDYADAQKELEKELARLRKELQVPEKDAPRSDPKYKPAAAPKPGGK